MLGDEKESKDLPNRSGFQEKVEGIEHPVLITIPDTKMSGFGRQKGSEIDRNLRPYFVGSENRDFLKSVLSL